jgi:hypothetical protein
VQPRKSAILVDPHQAGITDDIGAYHDIKPVL